MVDYFITLLQWVIVSAPAVVGVIAVIVLVIDNILNAVRNKRG